MDELLARLEGVWSETVAVTRAAATYLLGLTDPHDEDIIEIINCNHPVGTPCLMTPVFLVHGFSHNWSGWLPLLETLGDAGYHRFVRFNYESIGDPPEEIGGAFARRVHEVKIRLGIDRVHVVGHSLGGVVARYWSVVLDGADDLGHAVTLGSPNAGTPWAVLPGLPRGLKELKPGSELVAILTGGTDDRTKWTTIAGGQDLLVPGDYAHFAGTNQQNFTALGHVGLLYDEGVLDAVAEALTTADGV